MFNFYLGDLNLQHENVRRAGAVAANEVSEHIAINDPAFFNRFLHQVMYFWAHPEVIKNPITALFANGYLPSVHPGTSRLLGPYLANAKTVPCLGVFNRDLMLKKSLEQYLFNSKETEDYFFTKEEPSPNSFHYSKEDKSVTDQGWFNREPVKDIVHSLIWAKEPNISWVNRDGKELYKQLTDLSKATKVIQLDNFSQFWQSLIDIANQ